MLAYGTGVKQLATRIALYWAAKEAMSAEVVPGMPLASDAPGAPAVEPPMAAGQVGVGGGGGGAGGVWVGTGAEVTGAGVTGAGVVVKVRPAMPALATFTATAAVCCGAAVVVAVAALVVVVAVVDTAAGVALPPRSWVSAAELLLGTSELATISRAARFGEVWTDGPAP